MTENGNGPNNGTRSNGNMVDDKKWDMGQQVDEENGKGPGANGRMDGGTEWDQEQWENGPGGGRKWDRGQGMGQPQEDKRMGQQGT